MALRARADQSNRFNPFNDPNIRQIEVQVNEQDRIVVTPNVEGQENEDSGSPEVEEGEIPLAEETMIDENLAREEEMELEPRHEQSDLDRQKLDGNLVESVRNVESQDGKNQESDVEEKSNSGEIREREKVGLVQEETSEEEGFFDNSYGLVSLFNDDHKQPHPLDLEAAPLIIDQRFSMSAFHGLLKISPSYLSSPFMFEKTPHTLYRQKSTGNDIPLPTFDSEEEEDEENRSVAILLSLEESQPCEFVSQCDVRREVPFKTKSGRLVKRPNKLPW